MFNFLVLPFVLWHGFGFGGRLAGKLEALFDRTEEFRGNVVNVLQSGDDVGWAGDGLHNTIEAFFEFGSWLRPTS